MPKGYHHLTYVQRSQIAILKARGDSLNKIAKALNVHHSTISRELKRNSGEQGYNYLSGARVIWSTNANENWSTP